MMHWFGMSFGMFWLIIPAVALCVGLPFLRNFIRRTNGRSLSDNAPQFRAPDDSDAVIYRLAKKLKGRVTVSDVVVATGMSSDQAEQLLQKMVDGTRVRMEVSSEGMVLYEFLELMGEEE